jgi:hypothetical protein
VSEADEALARLKADPDREPHLINLTVRVDDFVLLYAKVRAFNEHRSINGLIADFLSEYSGVPTRPVPRRLPRPIRPRTIYEEARREARRRRQGGPW